MGLTRRKYERYIAPLDQRFWHKVARAGTDECWLWRAARVNTGYGIIGSGGSTHRMLLAHRVSWEIHSGQRIPPGGVICHTCNNKACVNPAHLYCGTHATNASDARRDGVGPQGERHGMARLTTEQVLEIRRLHASGAYLQKELAERFNTGQNNISRIVRRLRWKHI